MKRWVKSVVTVVIFGIVLSTAFLTKYLVSVQKYQNNIENITYVHIDALNIADGLYIGECNVQFIYVKVMVTVKNHVITDIQLLEHRQERGAAAERILKDIIHQQKIDVDFIAGATNSSKVIKKAVDNALSTMPQ